jgi:hypothetical protein
MHSSAFAAHTIRAWCLVHNIRLLWGAHGGLWNGVHVRYPGLLELMTP